MEKKLVCVQSQGGKWGAIDKDGKFAVPLKYADCKVIDDHAYFKAKKKDEKTVMRINLIEGTQEEWHESWSSPDPSKRYSAPENSETLQWRHFRKVLKDGKYSLWISGKYITDYEYDDISYIDTCFVHCKTTGNNYFVVTKDGLSGVINHEGKIIVPIEFHKVEFNDDLWNGHSYKENQFFTAWSKEGGHWDKAFLWNGEDITESIWVPEFAQYDSYRSIWELTEFASHFLVQKGDLYGIFDIKKRKEIIPCEYENFVTGLDLSGCNEYTLCGRLENFYDGIPAAGYITCVRDGKFGIYDTEGNMVIDCKYDAISHTTIGVVIKTEEGLDLYDENYNLMEKNIETYDESSAYYEGFMTCKKDGVEYVRDKEGNRYIEGKYDIREFDEESDGSVETQIEDMLDTEHFSHGLMPVCKDYAYGYIDTSFNEVIPLQYSFASNFNKEGYAFVKRSEMFTDRTGPWSLIDTKGNIIVEWPGDQFRYDPETGLIRVHSRKRCWGIIDMKGNEIVMDETCVLADGPKKWMDTEDIYCYEDPYCDWYIIARKGQEPFVINSQSREAISNYIGPEFFKPEYSPCHRYPLTVAGGKWVAADENLDIVTPEHYDSMCDFKEGLSAVKKDGLWGYIDVDGKVVIPFQFEFATDMANGYAGITQNGKWGLIDKTGQVVVPPEYADVFWEMAEEWGCVFAKKGSKLIKFEV